MLTTAWNAAELLAPLVRFASVSNTSNREVSQWVAERLDALGFQIETVPYTDPAGVPKVNVIARRGPRGSAGLAYFAHTDVVPAPRWTGPAGQAAGAVGAAAAFTLVADQQRLYGRGSCDMKGSLACMLAAASQIDAREQTRPLTICCTADEEVGFEGARQVVAQSRLYQQLVAEQPLAIIGEPTQMRVVHAHKGIAGYRFASRGRAAHSSTRQGVNANLAMVPLLVELKRCYDASENDGQWQHDAFDPPTLSWNFGISDHATAVNVTPASSHAWLFYRPMPGIDGDGLVQSVLRCAAEHGLEIQPMAGGEPLWVDPDSECVQTVCRLADRPAAETVCYGTDGGQFTQLEKRVVIGPGDIEQAHTDDEWISRQQLDRGVEVYAKLIRDQCV
ncbi:M20 family metallopeptidase [Roseimaritima sediminicola]|uniref:M20 family metallopeptidase n=1 Tax=Roseimaritima sediminicola TaxID=2662066 RepID=UPI00129824C3|nr:M20 family metallopeptidase [Roseimaritima sediminicola]